MKELGDLVQGLCLDLCRDRSYRAFMECRSMCMKMVRGFVEELLTEVFNRVRSAVDGAPPSKRLELLRDEMSRLVGSGPV